MTAANPNDAWVTAILAQSSIGGRFVNIRLNGNPVRGFSSYVFEADDQRTRRPVMLKFLRPEMANVQPWDGYFTREGEISTALIGHKNFVQLAALPGVQTLTMRLDNGLDIAFPLRYLAMEKAVRDLDAYLYEPRRRLRALWRKLQIVRDVAKAVAKLHRLGYSHRDIKPDNIFLYAGGDARLGDLGLCRPIGLHDPLAQAYNQPAGHQMYAAPETFCGSGNDFWRTESDWFAVGAVLFETISGVRLYSAIGLTNPLDLVVAFARFGPLDRFLGVVGDIAGAYPIPAMYDYAPRELHFRHDGPTLDAIDSLVRGLCHFDYRKRLCDLTRILRQIDIAIALARRDDRRNDFLRARAIRRDLQHTVR